MRVASLGHAVFAATMVALGTLGLVQGDFVPMWAPVPQGLPGRLVLVQLCALIPLISGAGLVWRRTAAVASRVLLGWLVAWLLLVRVPYLIAEFSVGTWWSAGQMAVMTAAAWVPYAWFAGDLDAPRLALVTGRRGLRISRALFGLGLIPFGLAHFLYLDATAPLIPGWLPWHVPLSYATGATFIAAGLASLTGIQARLAATLTTIQIAGFTLIVWLPVVVAGRADAGQWHEFVASVTLTAGAWMVANGHRGARRA